MTARKDGEPRIPTLEEVQAAGPYTLICWGCGEQKCDPPGKDCDDAAWHNQVIPTRKL